MAESEKHILLSHTGEFPDYIPLAVCMECGETGPLLHPMDIRVMELSHQIEVRKRDAP